MNRGGWEAAPVARRRLPGWSVYNLRRPIRPGSPAVPPMQRINITQPSDWVEAFKAQAEKDGLTLSEWMGEACLARLPDKVRKKLSERTLVGRPAIPTEGA